MSSKLAKDPLIVTITNSGFYLGSELDHRMKFHSWHLAKVVNDLAIENGTCLTQGSFNSLSGVSWIIRDQHREFEFDKRKYRTRPAKIWNFLPDEILARSQEPDVTKTFAKEDEETSDAASDK
jgi:hypothetical protein